MNLKFKTYTINNGLTVCIANTDYTVTCGRLVINSGSKDGKGGVAHFSEHTVFKNIDEMQKFEEKYGGYIIPGTTSVSFSHFDFSLSNSGLSKVFNIFGNFLFHQELEDGEIERQRAIIINEHRELSENHIYISEEHTKRFQKSLYGDHWKANNIYENLGSIDEISQISKMDLQAFRDQHYVPANMTLIILTSKQDKEILNLINKSTLSSSKPGTRNPKEKLLDSLNKPEMVRWDKEGNYNNSLRSIYVIPGTVSKPTIEIATEMIKKYLNKKLSEEDLLLYSIGFKITFYVNLWQIEIFRSKIANNLNKKIEKVINREIMKTLKSKYKFNRYKNKLIKKSINSDTSLGAFNILNNATEDLLFYDKIQNYHEKIQSYINVSFEDVQQLIPYFEPNNKLTISITNNQKT